MIQIDPNCIEAVRPIFDSLQTLHEVEASALRDLNKAYGVGGIGIGVLLGMAIGYFSRWLHVWEQAKKDAKLREQIREELRRENESH